MNVRFDWDPRKSTSNLRKHGLSFEAATGVFNDPFALLAPDPKHSSTDETREWVIGEIGSGVAVVVFTRRENGRLIRIISARKASRQERALYEINKRVPI